MDTKIIVNFIPDEPFMIGLYILMVARRFFNKKNYLQSELALLENGRSVPVGKDMDPENLTGTNYLRQKGSPLVLGHSSGTKGPI